MAPYYAMVGNKTVALNPNLTASEKAVFLVLAGHANAERTLFLSEETIMKCSGLSKNTVKKAIKGLKEKKVITITRRKRPNGRYPVNHYKLNDYNDIHFKDSSYCQDDIENHGTTIVP